MKSFTVLEPKRSQTGQEVYEFLSEQGDNITLVINDREDGSRSFVIAAFIDGIHDATRGQ